MRLASFVHADQSAYGAVHGDHVVRLDQTPGAPVDLCGYIARHCGDWPAAVSGEEIPLHAVRLLPPIAAPGKILCVATNFREGKPDPEFPLTFTRFADTIVGHGEPLLKPAVSQKYDYEGELAVIIGKPGHKIAREQALDHVAGYSCFNDGSVRDWQKHSSQFIPGKNFHRSGSMGPWLTTADEIDDFAAIELRTRVNGVVKQDISMARMIFDVAWLVSYFSTFTPLAPGDVIATGTPSGFGSTRTPPEFLVDGDRVDVEISGLGTLTNIVRQDAG